MQWRCRGVAAHGALRGSGKSAATGSSPPPDLPPTGTDVAVLPPAVSSNDGASRAVGGGGAHVADKSTLRAFLSRPGHTTTGVLVDPYGSSAGMETVSRADQSAPPLSSSSAAAANNAGHSPKTKQDARTILRGLAPLELIKQKAVLSGVTGHLRNSFS